MIARRREVVAEPHFVSAFEATVRLDAVSD
jgi:hypothetical protein